MNRTFIAVAAALTLSAMAVRAQAPARMVPIAEAWSGTSVNTTIFRAGSVVSRAGVQYAAFYDPEGRLTLARRRLGTDAWQTAATQYTGNVADAHNVISIAVDADGFLHVAFDHHDTPLRYCRSVAPDTLALGELRPMTGLDERRVTYPEFHHLTDTTMLFAYRSGASGRGNMVLNVYHTPTQRWTRLHSVLVDGEDRRSAYWQMCTDARGRIHLTWVWRETWMVETNHDICYACSDDGGLTWHRSDGTPYALPITAATAEYAWRVPQGSELINQTSMTVCADAPCLATYWTSAADSVPQFRLVWLGADGWRSTLIGRRSMPFSLSGGGTKMIPVSRPCLAGSDSLLVCLFRDAERGSRVTAAVASPARPDRWVPLDLTATSVDAWEPTIDTDLWLSDGLLHVFVQRTSQGDGERTVSTQPQPAGILEVDTRALRDLLR